MAASTRPVELHRLAFRLWSEGSSLSDIGKKLGVTAHTVGVWCRREGWHELATDLAPLIRERLLVNESDKLQDIQAQHLKEVKTLRLRALEMLDGYPIRMVVEKNEKTGEQKTTFVTRHLDPEDLEVVTNIWAKVAEIEQRLQGGDVLGKITGGDDRFPQLEAFLDKIYQETNKPLPVNGKVIETKALPAETPVTNGRKRKRDA